MMILLLAFFNLIFTTSADKTKGDSCSTNEECGSDLVCTLHKRGETTKECSDYFLQENQCCYGASYTYCGLQEGDDCKQPGNSHTYATCSALCDKQSWCAQFVFGVADKPRAGECWLESECKKIMQPCDDFDTYYRIKSDDQVMNCMKSDLEHKIKNSVQIEYINCADHTFFIFPNDPKDFNKTCKTQGKASLKGCEKDTNVTQEAECVAKNDGSVTYYRGWKIPYTCIATAICKRSDLDKLFIGKLKIEYAYCNGATCDHAGKATVKSCVGDHYTIHKDAQPATCTGTYTETSTKNYKGWHIPDSFRCIDLDAGNTSIPYHASMIDIIVFIMIATIVGLFIFLGIAYVIYYCYLNYCLEEL